MSVARRQAERAKGSLGMPASSSPAKPKPARKHLGRPRRQGSDSRTPAVAMDAGEVEAMRQSGELHPVFAETVKETKGVAAPTAAESSSSSSSPAPTARNEEKEVVMIPVGLPTGGLLRNFQRGGVPAMRAIMEMHRRHYRMPIREMQAVLERAGIDPSTIDEVPKVVST